MKNKTTIIAIAALLTCAAFTGCGKTESTTETEKQTEVSVVEESQTVESTETAEVKEPEAEESASDDNTYFVLSKDPYFDMDNAVKDEWATSTIDVSSPWYGKDILYNYVDGDKYAEITGATITEVNKSFNGCESSTYFFEHLAYYGQNNTGNEHANHAPMFALINTSLEDQKNILPENVLDQKEFTVLRTFTIPKDTTRTGNYLVIAQAEDDPSFPYVLCEVEYNGTVGYAIMHEYVINR